MVGLMSTIMVQVVYIFVQAADWQWLNSIYLLVDEIAPHATDGVKLTDSYCSSLSLQAQSNIELVAVLIISTSIGAAAVVLHDDTNCDDSEESDSTIDDNQLTDVR